MTLSLHFMIVPLTQNSEAEQGTTFPLYRGSVKKATDSVSMERGESFALEDVTFLLLLNLNLTVKTLRFNMI